MSLDTGISKDLIAQMVEGHIDDDNLSRLQRLPRKDADRFLKYLEVLQDRVAWSDKILLRLGDKVYLVRNAADAAPTDGGEILLSTGYRPGVRVTSPVSGQTNGQRVSLPLEVTVRDNGSGIPPDLLPYIFDPFVTAKTTGAGLGLALVAKIIGDHGGVVECESQPRRTLFRPRPHNSTWHR